MAEDLMKDSLAKLIQGSSLNRAQSREVMACIMDGQATPAQIASLVTILRMKGESIDEIAGFAEVMRGKAHRVETEQRRLLDTCGTGGDGMNTFNISTATAIIAAAGGVRVAKHGNRAASSKSGSADVLEALGVQITLDHEQAAACLAQTDICFMFAQVFHQSMKHAAVPRKEIGFRTIFNMLGPLTNPAGADRQLMGELEHIENYLEIQHLRYPNQLMYRMDIDENLQQVLIPPLSIQPFVENAIIHGFQNRREPFVMEVRIRKEEGNTGEAIIIAIRDNGQGFRDEMLDELSSGKYLEAKGDEHVGIWNVWRRLRMHAGEAAHIAFSNAEPHGAIVTIRLPLIEETKR